MSYALNEYINFLIESAKNYITDLFSDFYNGQLSKQDVIKYIMSIQDDTIKEIKKEMKKYYMSDMEITNAIERYKNEVGNPETYINIIELKDDLNTNPQHLRNVQKARQLEGLQELQREYYRRTYPGEGYKLGDTIQNKNEDENNEDDEKKEGSGKSSMYELHAVIINKRVPLEESKRISRDFIKGNRYYYRETTNSRRFRNIPKTKFISKSFRTKKINKDISLVYGELKPEFSHLKGSGFLSNIFNKAKQTISNIKQSVRVNPNIMGLLGYRYCGPSTRLEGQQPRNKIDQICMKHDFRFDAVEKAKKAGIDRATREAMTREADLEMLKSLKETKPEGFLEKIGHSLSTAGIAAKVKAEDLGLLDPLKFSGGKRRRRKRGGCNGIPCDVVCRR